MKSLSGKLFLCLLGGAVSAPQAIAQTEQPKADALTVNAAQLFEFADAARQRQDFAMAETAYRALANDPDPELRAEARFRLGMMLADDLKRYRDAATQFRAILDDKPDAARVRLELARMQALLGNLDAAHREMRAAQAAGLPPEVERMVRFYANALSASKPLGGSIEVTLAQDSNINRATKSDTLGTVIGDFTLDEDAKARSGVGLALRGQGYARLPLFGRLSQLAAPVGQQGAAAAGRGHLPAGQPAQQLAGFDPLYCHGGL
jgi:tetratricopeptide (TPR) repeat protein